VPASSREPVRTDVLAAQYLFYSLHITNLFFFILHCPGPPVRGNTAKEPVPVHLFVLCWNDRWEGLHYSPGSSCASGWFQFFQHIWKEQTEP
jgi:hypothetical protein